MLEFLITWIVKLKHCFELINIVWSFQSQIRAFPTTCCIISNITLQPGPFVSVAVRAISQKALSLSDTRFLKHGLAGRRDFPNLQLKWHRNRQATLKACFPHFLSSSSESSPCTGAGVALLAYIQSEVEMQHFHPVWITVDMDRERDKKKKP